MPVVLWASLCQQATPSFCVSRIKNSESQYPGSNERVHTSDSNYLDFPFCTRNARFVFCFNRIQRSMRNRIDHTNGTNQSRDQYASGESGSKNSRAKQQGMQLPRAGIRGGSPRFRTEYVYVPNVNQPIHPTPGTRGQQLEDMELRAHIATRHIPIDATRILIRRFESVLVITE